VAVASQYQCGAMSAIGPKQTFHFALRMSAIGGKADIDVNGHSNRTDYTCLFVIDWVDSFYE
jgi:hypothetical protein